MIIYGGDWEGPTCERNVGQYFLDYLLKYDSRVALIDPLTNSKYTYNELRTLSIRCAMEMRSRGISKGDIVIVCARNHLSAIIPILSAVYLGATVNPLHPNYSYNELFRMINITEPRMIICDEKVEDTIRKIRFQLGLTTQIVTFENGFEKFIEIHDENNNHIENIFKTEDVDVENDNIFIMCTSGTTGLIKGVTLKHKSYFTTLVMYRELIQNDDNILMFSPYAWITGIWNMGATIFVGATKVLTEYDPTRIFDLLYDYQISWALISPFALTTMVRNPQFANYPDIPKNLKTIIFGGSKVSDEQYLEYIKHFPDSFVFNGYGSTEIHLLHAYFSPFKDRQLIKKKINSNGYPPPGVYWKIVDNETNQPVGRNTKGELWIKSSTLTKNYYKDPIATDKAIDKDGFYHTGDIVMVDDDNCIYVVGRIKEILKYKLWQISPTEVEQLIRGYPAVQQVCVIGRPHPTDGDLPLAFIVKKTGYENATKTEIMDYVAENGSDVQKLRGGVHFLDHMPMTISGKIKKSELEKLVSNVTEK